MRASLGLFIFVAIFFCVDARAERILIVGDSISCGPFGAELVQHLSQAGHQVKLYCAVSSAPRDWLNGHNPRRTGSSTWLCQTRVSGSTALGDCDGSSRLPTFSEVLAHNPSDRVIVALGTNSLPSRPDTTYSKMLELISRSGRRCVWIGPPHLQPERAYAVAKGDQASKIAAKKRISGLEAGLNSFYDSLATKLSQSASTSQSASKGCALIDSREATAPGTTGNETVDGIHATASAARYRYAHMANSLSFEPTGTQMSNQASPTKSLR